MPAPAHHDHHLPTLIFHELMAVALFATSAYHSSQSKATQASFGLTFIAAIVYQTVLHLPSWNGLTCWSAPSLLSTSQYLPRPHEILFMTVALYISFITVQTMSRTYPRCRTALVQGLLTAVTFLLVVLPSHLLSAAFLWRTWHSNLPTVMGVPINEIERLLLFTTCLQLSSLLPRRTTAMHQHVKRALLSVLACCLLQFNGYIVPRLRIVVLTMVYGVLPLVLLFINNNTLFMFKNRTLLLFKNMTLFCSKSRHCSFPKATHCVLFKNKTLYLVDFVNIWGTWRSSGLGEPAVRAGGTCWPYLGEPSGATSSHYPLRNRVRTILGQV